MRLSPKGMRVFLAVVVALAVLTAGLFAGPRLLDWLRPVDHTVAETVVPDREVPGTVSEVAWEWRPPENELIDGVLPIPNGAVAVSDSGVTALEGVAGEEMWRYRRSDAVVRSANVTPDRESVVVSFSDMDVEEDARVETIVVLDGRSGEIRDEYELSSPSVEASASRFRHVTDEVFLAPGENAMGIDAFALEGGERVWSHEGGGAGAPGPLITAEGTAIATETVSEEPGGELTLMMTGLDTETGEVLWEEEQPLADYEEPFELRHEPSWGAIHLRFVEQGEGTVHLLLDPSTGQVLAVPSAQPFWVLESGYVTLSRAPEDEDRVQYEYRSFDDAEERSLTAENGSADADLHPGLATEEGVLRLSYAEEDMTRGPTALEVLPWEGEPRTIPLGFTVHEWLAAGSGGTPAETSVPHMVSAPGAVVVVDQENWGTEMVGLN